MNPSALMTLARELESYADQLAANAHQLAILGQRMQEEAEALTPIPDGPEVNE